MCCVNEQAVLHQPQNLIIKCKCAFELIASDEQDRRRGYQRSESSAVSRSDIYIDAVNESLRYPLLITQSAIYSSSCELNGSY